MYKCTLTEVHEDLIKSENVEYMEWLGGLHKDYIKYLETDINHSGVLHPFIFVSTNNPIYIADRAYGRYCHCSHCRKIRETYPTYRNNTFFHG